MQLFLQPKTESIPPISNESPTSFFLLHKTKAGSALPETSNYFRLDNFKPRQ
jgi:hypothetical protein